MVEVYFTAKDPIVRSCFRSLSTLVQTMGKDAPVVVGGMGVQLYCLTQYPDLLRSTNDLDVITRRSFEDFREFESYVITPIRPEIQSLGYRIQGSRNRSGLVVRIMLGQNRNAKELFFIGFDYPPKAKDTPRERVIVEREIAMAKDFEFEGMGLKIKRIEDLIPRKQRRIREKLESFGLEDEGLLRAFSTDVENGNWERLANAPLEHWKGILNEHEKKISEVAKSGGDLRSKPAAYVVGKDVYDICLLSRVIVGGNVSFDAQYYEEAKRELDSS